MKAFDPNYNLLDEMYQDNYYSPNLDTAGTGGKGAGTRRTVWNRGFLCRKISGYPASWG